jgi:TPR repeat protein
MLLIGMKPKGLGLLLACLWLIGVAEEAIAASNLESVFLAGRYKEFFNKAQQQADSGDADAQFLLGKAYHLGMGVDVDLTQARYYYGLAAKQNSARAVHNLGIMVMDEQPEQAQDYFNRALELGLKLPTYYNLGQIYSKRCSNFQSEEWCNLAGDNYAQAWELEGKDFALEEVVTAYSKACLIARNLSKLFNRGKVSAVAVEKCEQATDWADKGVELGLANATYNRGAIEIDAERYAEALPWFRLAYERGLGLAAYSLGVMYEEGQGVPKDEAEAIIWYGRGAELKDEHAIQRMRKHWEQEIDLTYSAKRIEEILAFWDKLEPKQEPLYKGLNRLELIETIERNAQYFQAIAKQPIQTRFCSEQLWLYENELWRIFSVSKPQQAGNYVDRIPLVAEGKADAEGCIVLNSTAKAKLREALESGATPMVNWPGRRHLLSIIKGPTGDLELEVGLEVTH